MLNQFTLKNKKGDENEKKEMEKPNRPLPKNIEKKYYDLIKIVSELSQKLIDTKFFTNSIKQVISFFNSFDKSADSDYYEMHMNFILDSLSYLQNKALYCLNQKNNERFLKDKEAFKLVKSIITQLVKGEIVPNDNHKHEKTRQIKETSLSKDLSKLLIRDKRYGFENKNELEVTHIIEELISILKGLEYAVLLEQGKKSLLEIKTELTCIGNETDNTIWRFKGRDANDPDIAKARETGYISILSERLSDQNVFQLVSEALISMIGAKYEANKNLETNSATLKTALNQIHRNIMSILLRAKNEKDAKNKLSLLKDICPLSKAMYILNETRPNFDLPQAEKVGCTIQ